MKNSVLAALISVSSAAKLNAAPDVYGPNGVGYSNVSADPSMSDIGIDILTKGAGEKCSSGDWTKIHYVGSLKDGRVVTDSRAE